MNLVDILALLFILLHVILSWRHGLSGELGHLVGSIAAIVLGVIYHDEIAGWMVRHTRLEGRAADVVAFAGTALAILLAALVLHLLTSRLIKLTLAEDVDKLLGGLAGMLKSAIYVAIVFLILMMVPHDYLNRHFGHDSLIGRTVAPLIPSVQDRMEQWSVGERLREGLERGREDLDAMIDPNAIEREARRLKARVAE